MCVTLCRDQDKSPAAQAIPQSHWSRQHCCEAPVPWGIGPQHQALPLPPPPAQPSCSIQALLPLVRPRPCPRGCCGPSKGRKVGGLSVGADATRLGWEQDLPLWAGEGDSLARGVGRFSTQHPTSSTQHPTSSIHHPTSSPPPLPLPSSCSHWPHKPCYDAIKSQNTFALWRGACQESQVRHRLELLKYSEEPQPQ